MRPPGIDERRGNDAERDAPTSRWRDLQPGRSVWRFAALVGVAWAAFVGALGTAARLLTDEPDRPSWGEVLGATVFNSLTMFVIAVAFSLIVRTVTRRGAEANRDDVDTVRSAPNWFDRATQWTVRGRAVVPTTSEGRWALLAAMLGVVPFLGGPAMVAALVLFVLAVRRGDRAILLALPLLVGLFLVAFLVAEFTVGHD